MTAVAKLVDPAGMDHGSAAAGNSLPPKKVLLARSVDGLRPDGTFPGLARFKLNVAAVRAQNSLNGREKNSPVPPSRLVDRREKKSTAGPWGVNCVSRATIHSPPPLFHDPAAKNPPSSWYSRDCICSPKDSVEKMIGLRRTLIFACCGLLPLTACSRTSDGTLIIKKPPAVSSLVPSWVRPKSRQAEFASQLPPAPQVHAAAAAATGARAAKQRAKPVARLGRKANLKCLERSKPGERVRVVCA